MVQLVNLLQQKGLLDKVRIKLHQLYNFYMKPNYRTRKVVLGSVKPTQQQRLQTPMKLPPNRIILRAHKKQDDMGPKIIHQQSQQSDKEASQKRKTNTFYSKEVQDDVQYNHQNQSLEARDRRTILKYDFRDRKFQLDHEQQKLNEWLGQMHFKVVSSSFKLYLSSELSFQEVKVHCCQNLLLNILNFLQSLTENSDNSLYNSQMRKQPLSYLEMTEILKHINQVLIKNLAYMQIKYPLTKDSKPNKSLQSLITKINNLGNDEHDVIMKSKVQFQLKSQESYTSQIMKFINFLITKQTQLCGIKGNNKKQLTYFQYFYETMEKIFTSIYKPDFNLKDNEKSKEQIDPIAIFAKLMSQENIQNEVPEGKTKQEKEYKQKVMKYTHYMIGQKISSNTELYSDKEIQTEIFDVKNSSILRILTKWTQELEKKIMSAEQEILKRPFRFKRNKESEFSKLNANQKNDLYQNTQRCSKQVTAFNEQLKLNYNEIESMLSSHLRQGPEYKNIPKNQYKVGFFCSKIQAAASSTLLSYLNKIIHILLLIPEQLKKMHAHDEEYTENMNINLITFKISDLFRCKIKSRQVEIIRIFKEIKSISDRGQPFKIIRIKDRLNQGTRDIMVNILFKGIFLCEIQLAIEEYVQTKQLSYDSFSHFLYEMHRSRLGPIMESACTWAQFDQRVKIFRQINDNSGNLVKHHIQHDCDKEFFLINQYPFVCTLCQKFYSTQVGLIEHKKCNLCKAYYECSVCIYNKMSQQQISNLLNLNSILGIFKNDFRLWSYNEQEKKHRKFPLFGFIISKKMKKPEVIFFQTVIFKYDAYVIELKFNLDNEDKAQLIIIEKIQGNSEKQIKSIAEKYIIYEWKQEKAINNKIMPSNMKKMLEEEKKQREQIAKQKKLQKEKKKSQLQKKRQEQQERIAKFLRRGEGEDKRDKQEKEPKKVKENSSDQQSKQQKQTKPRNEATVKTAKYNENIFKRNQYCQVRVIEKQINGIIETFVLGIFLKQYTIRNKLKKMSNQDILQKLSTRKIQVLFMEDEFIHNEINEQNSINQIQLQQLKQTFEGISQVYFDNNYIDDLFFLTGIINLKVAHFSHNEIFDLDPLENLKQLTELILQNNKIQRIVGLRNKAELTELNLNRNMLTDLMFFDSIEENELGKLRNLYVNDNRIEFMNCIDKLTGLVKLDLSYNNITQIPEITTLLNLQQLDLSANKISKMNGVSNFVNLKKIYLNNNNIRIISKQIVNFRQLAILNLSNNKIKKIQHLNTGNFAKTLQILNLTNNKISKMQGLDTLQSLQQLYLGDNEIQSINSFIDLANLRILNLSFNGIEQLQLNLEDVEKYMDCLKVLNLSSNIVSNTDSNRKNIAQLSQKFGNMNVTFKNRFE